MLGTANSQEVGLMEENILQDTLDLRHQQASSS